MIKAESVNVCHVCVSVFKLYQILSMSSLKIKIRVTVSGSSRSKIKLHIFPCVPVCMLSEVCDCVYLKFGPEII